MNVTEALVPALLDGSSFFFGVLHIFNLCFKDPKTELRITFGGEVLSQLVLHYFSQSLSRLFIVFNSTFISSTAPFKKHYELQHAGS